MGELNLPFVVIAVLTLFNTVMLFYLCYQKFTGRLTLTFTKRKSCKKSP
jgi:hypothetical protein